MNLVARSDRYFDMGLRVTRSIASASGLLYDNSSVSYVGNISLPGDSVYASTFGSDTYIPVIIQEQVCTKKRVFESRVRKTRTGQRGRE